MNLALALNESSGHRRLAVLHLTHTQEKTCCLLRVWSANISWCAKYWQHPAPVYKINIRTVTQCLVTCQLTSPIFSMESTSQQDNSLGTVDSLRRISLEIQSTKSKTHQPMCNRMVMFFGPLDIKFLFFLQLQVRPPTQALYSRQQPKKTCHFQGETGTIEVTKGEGCFPSEWCVDKGNTKHSIAICLDIPPDERKCKVGKNMLCCLVSILCFSAKEVDVKK